MKRRALTFAVAATLSATLAGTVQAQSTLDSAQKTFRAADRNRDGILTSSEAGSASVPTQQFRTFDRDADGYMSRDEFVVFYRDLLVKAKQPVGADLEQEANRITGSVRAQEARRQLRQAEQVKQQQAKEAARAQAARNQLQRERKDAQANAQAEAKGLEARASSAVDDLQKRMNDGTLAPEDFRRLQSSLINDARNAARAAGAPADAPLTGVQQRLVSALQALEAKAQNGEVGSAAELNAIRNLAIQNAREAEARRLSRFEAGGHTQGTVDLKTSTVSPEMPFTLDLRRNA